MRERPDASCEARLRFALERSARVARRGPDSAVERLCDETAARLLDHLDPVRIQPRWVLELAMQCSAHERLTARFPDSRVASCGLSPRAFVPTVARRDRRAFALSASPSRLPLATGSADLAVSNLALYWLADLVPFFTEIWRVLRPGGLIAFVTLGPGTLEELRRSWRAVDDFSHIADFIDMHDIGDSMMRAGFGDVVMDAERVTITWPDVPAFLQDLRDLGTGNPLPGRAPGLTAPGKLAALTRIHGGHLSSGRLPATIELVHGHGWKPEARAEVPLDRLAPSP